MASTKEQIIRMIKDLPNNVSVEDVMAELYFRLQVDAGLKELNKGHGIPQKEVEKQMSKWLKR